MHRLLKRQINKMYGENHQFSKDFLAFIDLINSSYYSFQNDYNQLERTLELSSKESFKELAEFKAAVDTSAIISLTDLKGIIILANQNFCEISGYSVFELIGANHNIVNSGYHSKDFFQNIWKTISSGKVWQGEIRNKKKDGTFYWTNANLIPLYNDEGKIHQYIAIRFDITKRKILEEKLIQSEKNLAEVLSAINRTTAVIEFNTKGEIIEVNDIFLNLIKYSKEELIGKSYLIFIKEEEQLENNFNLSWENVLAGKTDNNEFKWTNKFGSNIWLTASYNPVLDENNNVKRIIIFINDITDKKLIENKLQESETRFRTLVQNSSDIITILKPDGTTVYESPSFYRIFGYSEKDIIGNSIFKFIHPDDVEKVAYEFGNRIQNGGVSDAVEFRFKHLNGNWIYIEAIGNNLLELPGINGIVINSRDITERKKAQEEGKKLKEFYVEILNKIPADVVVFDKAHKYLFANPLSVKDDELRNWIIGKDDYDYCNFRNKPIELADKRRKLFNEVLDSKKQFEIEESIINENGEKNWMLRRMFPVKNENDEVVNIIGFGLDITERKLSENKLKESEERLTLAITSANLGIWDWNIEQNILIWDQSMYKVFDINQEDFTGDYEAFEKTLHPDDVEKVNKGIENALKGLGEYIDDFRIFDSNGNIKYVAVYSKTFRKEDGTPIRMIGVDFDITESKLNELKILAAQQELEESQTIAKVGGWEINRIERKIKWSKEMYNIHELPFDYVPTIAHSYDFYTDDTKQLVIEKFKKAIENAEPFEIEAKIKTSKGNELEVRTKGVPIIENNYIKSIRGIFQDITKEKEAERTLKKYAEELELKNKELDQFAYIVSHDLKAPLRGINNLSLFIEEDLGDKIEAEVKESFDLMRGRVKRMEMLINGILEYSRAGRIKQEMVSFDLKQLIEELIDSIGVPNNFKILIPENLPIINAEKISFEQIFSNYISNAIKYNKNKNPLIEIIYKKNKGFYEFCVSDNGDGIESQFHEKVFVIFQTLQSRDSFESTGVGLAIVKKIVEDKGGKVWLESEKGKGAKFYFSWPIDL
jgi:PAS domain S-box-containing protein